MSSVAPQRIIFWLATMRSGHHAVMNWLLSGMPGPVAHRDNITRPLMGDYDHLVSRSRLPSHPVYRDLGSALTRSYAYERSRLRPVRRFMTECLERFPETQFHQIMVVRDPWNQFASHLQLLKRSQRAKPRDPTVIADFWVRYIRFGMKNNFTVIDFNRWATSSVYRDNLASLFNCEPDPTTLEQVPGQGGGSSFSGRIRPAKDALITRWQEWQDDPAWKLMVARDDVQNYARELWGCDCPTKLEVPT